MKPNTAKRIAKVKLTLTERTVKALEPADKPWIDWVDKLTGFGFRVQPSDTKSFVVNYRAGDGGRKAPNKRVVVARYGRVSPDRARWFAQELLGRVTGGGDPAGERGSVRLPTVGETCDDYIESGRGRARGPSDPIAATQASIWGTGTRAHWMPLRVATSKTSSTRSPSGMGRSGQPGAVVPTFGIPPTLRRPRGFVQSGRTVARRERVLSSEKAEADILPCRGFAALAQGN